MNNPEYVKIGNKKYKLNTDFRVAIACNKIAQDSTIGDTERALAIIYKLYGDKGLADLNNAEKLLELGIKYLLLGNETSVKKYPEELDMDFNEDMDYIETSFMSDYRIDLPTTNMHWWKFFNLINGLSNSELGNCCVLNRIRNLRTFDVSKIKDSKERERILKAKEEVALKVNKKENKLTKQQEESMRRLNKIIGL